MHGKGTSHILKTFTYLYKSKKSKVAQSTFLVKFTPSVKLAIIL